MATQRITLDPDPPVQGQRVRICYDFDGSGLSSTTLGVSFDGGDETDHEVDAENPCVTIDVPDGAILITVSDSSSVSPNKTAPVVPP